MELESQLRDEGYTDEEAREIVRRATRLQAGAGSRMSRQALEESAAEAGISREWIEEAARQVQAGRATTRQRRGTLRVVAIGAAVLLALFLGSSYNSLNRADIRVAESRGQLETVLQRRFDLIPNLVKVTREYATHESRIFDDLTAARGRFERAGTLAEKEAAATQLQQALPRVLAIAESNPQLRSSDLYLRLQDELAGTENRIAVERRRYNQAAADYNRLARSFPTVLVRPLFGFKPQEPYFQAAPGSQRPPEF